MPPNHDVKDLKLLELVRTGDASALGELLTRHAPAVRRFAMTMCRDRDNAEDVAQETLLAAVRGAKDVRSTASFTTWLYAVARRFCTKMRRRQNPSSAGSVDDPSEVPSEASSPDENAAAHELATALDRALCELDDKYREVIVLRDVEGLSAPEVAAVLGLSIEAIKSRLHRARTAMRASLGSSTTTPEISDLASGAPSRARERPRRGPPGGKEPWEHEIVNPLSRSDALTAEAP